MGQGGGFGAVTLSWFARRILLFERLVLRLGTATAASPYNLLRVLLEAEQRAQAGVDAIDVGSRYGLLGSKWGLDTRASLRTQGDHRDPEEQLVTDEVVEDEGLAVVGDEIGLLRGEVVVVLSARRLAAEGRGNG